MRVESVQADSSRPDPAKPSFEGGPRKKGLRPDDRRQLVVHAREQHGMSLRQACKTFSLSTSSFRYQAKKNEGFKVNHKRLHRIYKQAKLNIRRRTRRRVASRVKAPLVRPLRPNVMWSMDLMHDRLLNGQPLRSFNVMDEYNREVLNITISKSIPATRVINELSQLMAWRGKPAAIRVDNGP